MAEGAGARPLTDQRGRVFSPPARLTEEQRAVAQEDRWWLTDKRRRHVYVKKAARAQGQFFFFCLPVSRLLGLEERRHASFSASWMGARCAHAAVRPWTRFPSTLRVSSTPVTVRKRPKRTVLTPCNRKSTKGITSCCSGLARVKRNFFSATAHGPPLSRSPRPPYRVA